MLSERETVKKLEEYAQIFEHHCRNRKWGEAKNIYNMAHTVAIFMDMGEAVLKRLFGDWDSDDGNGEAIDNGMFQRWRVEQVDKECCIRRNQAYEDQACRRMGQQTRYYSEDSYCAICYKKRAARARDSSA